MRRSRISIRLVLAVAMVSLCLTLCACGTEKEKAVDAVAEAEPYQREMDSLRRELESHDKPEEIDKDATVLCGAYVKEQAQLENLDKAAIVIFSIDADTDLLKAIGESGRESIVVSTEEVSEEKVQRIRKYVEPVGIVLRSHAEDMQDVDDACALEFRTYSIHMDSCEAGFQENGMFCLPYIYAKSDENPVTTRVEQLIAGKNTLLIIFPNTTGENWTYVQQQIKGGDLLQESVAQTMERFERYEEEEAVKQAEYETYVAEKEARIEELRKIIADIYETIDPYADQL